MTDLMATQSQYIAANSAAAGENFNHTNNTPPQSRTPQYGGTPNYSNSGPFPANQRSASGGSGGNNSNINEEESGHRFEPNNLTSASADFTPEKRKYLKLANDVSFGKLENHLRHYVRSIPFRPAPTYIAPGDKMPPPARPSKFKEDWDQVFERDPAQEDILEHSASFRYCAQRLAMGFHSPYERDRRVIDYKTFAKVLSVPNPTTYEALDPKVEDIPENELAEAPSVALQQSSSFSGGTSSIQQSKFLAQRLAAAKKKGVQLKMSKTDVSKELARMDMEDKQDEEIDAAELLEKKQQERDAQREAERKKREAEDAQKGRPQVVNMYDLPDWRHAHGRCHVTTLESWKGAKSAYF